MIYQLSNMLIINNQLQFMTVEGFATESLANPVHIQLSNGTISNTRLHGKDSLFVFNDFVYQGLRMEIANFSFSFNRVELGFLLNIAHSSNLLLIRNCSFSHNYGIIALVQAQKHINVSFESSFFSRNTAKEALFQTKANVLLSFSGSVFKENYSLGRGSIIFADTDSFVEMIQSEFHKNYALLGGVFFS